MAILGLLNFPTLWYTKRVNNYFSSFFLVDDIIFSSFVL